jgi:hypothetical protein
MLVLKSASQKNAVPLSMFDIHYNVLQSPFATYRSGANY